MAKHSGVFQTKKKFNHCGKLLTTRFQSCAQLVHGIPWKTSACSYVVIDESKIVRRSRNESHVSSDLVQFSVALRPGSMRCLECGDFQSGPWVQCKVPALPNERSSEIKPKCRRERNYTRSSTWMVFFALLCVNEGFGFHWAGEDWGRTIV